MMMIQHETAEKKYNNGGGLPSPTKTVASTVAAAEDGDAPQLNFLERAARRVARWPKTHFWVAILGASALSAASMYFGDFYVTVDNVGWPSRGTLIANRHTQTKLINDNRKHLAKTNSAALWEELTTTVQVGWEFKHLEKDKKKESSNSNTEERRALQEAWSDKLQQEEQAYNSVQRSNLTTILKECDVRLYTNPDFVQRKRLWPVWKLQSTNASASVLDPPILKDLCDAEEQTQRLLEQEGLCFGCNGGKCLPPYSPVLYARFMIPNGFVLDCQELTEQWGPYQAKTEQKWKECVTHMRRVGQDYLDNRGPCPSIFSPSLVDDHFDDTGKVRYTSSIFVTIPKLSEKYYELSDQFHRGSSDDHQLIKGTYDTQYMDFIAYYARDIVNEDMVLAVGSAMITTLAMLFHTQSPFLTFIGIIQIALSFPLAFGVYRFVFGLTFFPFLNLIGLFVVFALGADHVFVAVDKWKNARKEHPRATTEQVAIQALPSAGKAMILTTITTAVAFFGSALCVVAPIRLFAIFCGLLIVFDYILDVIVMFPCLVIYDGYRHQRNYCVDFRYHDPVEATTEEPKDRSERRSRNEGAEEEKVEDEDDYYEDVDCGFKKETSCDDTASESSGDPFEIPNPNLIQRILQSYYNVLHTWRWPVLVLSLAALGVCSYFATTLDVPVSSTDIQLLGDSVEYEQNRQWRKELLMSTLLQQSGSIAYLNWGLTPADTGDHDNPKEFSTLVLDESFDPSTEAAQIYLKEFCETMFVQKFAEPISDGYSCPFSQFDHWLELQASLPFEDQNATYVDHCDGAAGIPMPEDSFHACMSSWVVQVDHRDVLSWNGVVKVLTLPFLARVRFDSPNDELRDEWNLIENWVQAERLTAPIEVSGAFFSSFDFWFWDTSSNVYKTAIESGAIAIAVSALVILISSRSLTMTLFSAASVVYVLVSVASVMSAAGWTLGFLESICFTILIGLSADFVIHLSHAYTELPGNTDRHTRTKYALIHLGPSILAAGFTTLVGAAIMLFTTIHFFRLFAMVLFFTIVQATIGSFVVFLGITDCIGPANPTYAADCALSKISAWGKRQHTNEDTTKARGEQPN